MKSLFIVHMMMIVFHLPITAVSPNLTKLEAVLVILPVDPVTQPPTRHTRKVVSSHNTAYYLLKTKCYVIMCKL